MAKRKKRKEKSRIRGLAIILILIIVIGGGGLLLRGYWDDNMAAFDLTETSVIEVTIPSGSTTKEIGQILEESGLIHQADFFALASRIRGHDGSFRAGSYALSPSMDMDTLFSRLLTGQDETLRFTIPEGYDIRRLTDALTSQGLVDPDRFKDALNSDVFSYRFLEGIPKTENRLEGFLYPDTYEIFVHATEMEIIKKMLEQFDRVFTSDHYERVAELEMTLREIMTLASIIEREAVVSEDRPLISGVFYNRLKVGMPLQSCATVQYILGEQKPVLSTADTQIDSPFNTYQINGLPPSPICSPGIDSIEAALWPTETDYLFFLAKGDGSHVFSHTYEEHLRNKAIYIDK